MKKRQNKTKKCVYCKQEKPLRFFEFHSAGAKRIGTRRSECTDCRKKNQKTGVSQRKRTVSIVDYLKLQRLLHDIGEAWMKKEKDVENLFIEKIEEAVKRFEKCNRCKKTLKKLQAYFPICQSCSVEEEEEEQQLQDIEKVQEQTQVEQQILPSHIVEKDDKEDEEDAEILINMDVEKNKKIIIKWDDLLWHIYNEIERSQYHQCPSKDCRKNPLLRPMVCLDVKKQSDIVEKDHYLSTWLYCFFCQKNYYLCQKHRRIHYIQRFLNIEDPSKKTILYYHVYVWAKYLVEKHHVNIKLPSSKKLVDAFVKKRENLFLKNPQYSLVEKDPYNIIII